MILQKGLELHLLSAQVSQSLPVALVGMRQLLLEIAKQLDLLQVLVTHLVLDVHYGVAHKGQLLVLCVSVRAVTVLPASRPF